MEHLSDPVSPKTKTQQFADDDLEFRTITTLLALMQSRERVQLDNFEVTNDRRPYLKLLTSFSSLLVRHHEILAILPKRSHRGTELFLSTQGELPDDPSSTLPSSPSPPSSPLSDSSSSSSSSLCHFLTRNPRNDGPVDTGVELLEPPTLDIGTDILGFIVENWDQSFNHHVKAFETLLNTSLVGPPLTLHTALSNPWSNLKTYSLFQSIRKTQRRFRNSDFIKRVNQIDPLTLKVRSSFLGLTNEDDGNIIMAFRDTSADGAHSALLDLVSRRSPGDETLLLPEDPQSFLVEFHEFFKWFLGVVSEELSMLDGLRKMENPPEKLPSNDIIRTQIDLKVLHYFAWRSDFFTVYVGAVLGAVDRVDPDSVIDMGAADRVDLDSAIDMGEMDTSEDKIDAPESNLDAEEEDRLDIATEFDTGDGSQAKSQTSSSFLVNQWVSQLRLITSNIQHLLLLEKCKKKLKGMRIKFKVLRYSPSDSNLKPWRDVITGLFSGNTAENTAETVIQALRQEANEEKNPIFRVFLPGRPPLRFKGRAHCEVVLGCLYTLANDDGDITWTGITPNLLRTIKHSYNLLAPSKRCCPVCATTIDLLSTLSISSRRLPLQALSKHNIISPCAFPIGLPATVRAGLLVEYKKQLRDSLLALVAKRKRDSESSNQSDPLSVDGTEDDEEDKKQEREEQAWGLATQLMQLGEEEKGARWKFLLKTFDKRVTSLCWSFLGDGVKEGLRPPV